MIVLKGKNLGGIKRMQCVKEYIAKLASVREIMEKHLIDTTQIDAMLEEIDNYKIAAPVIGNFSTGKSSLVNAILEKKILSVDITPKTAVPTEVYYGENKVYLWKKDGTKDSLDIESLPLKDRDIINIEKVSIEYENEFLKEINNVKIVDMPGFDTKIKNHNKAIKSYIPNSMAYILLVSVDEPVLKDDLTDFLRDLDVYEIPLYVVLTKCSRISKEELAQCKELIVNIINKIIMDYEVKVTFAESYGDVSVDGVKDFFRQIQKDADKLFERRYKSKVYNLINDIKTYISAQLLKKGMTYSELEIEKEKINARMDELMGKVESEMKNFDEQTKECILDIEKKITSEFEKDIRKYTVMIQNNEKLDPEINRSVKKVVSISVKNEYEPRLRNYLKRMADMIKIDILEDDAMRIELLDITTQKTNIATAKMVLPLVCAVIGGVVGKIIGLIIGLIIGVMCDVGYNIYQSKLKNDNSEKLAEKIVNMVVEKVMISIKEQIKNFSRVINDDLQNEIVRQKNLLNKALEDIEMRIGLENTIKNRQIEELEDELVTIKKILLKV